MQYGICEFLLLHNLQTTDEEEKSIKRQVYCGPRLVGDGGRHRMADGKDTQLARIGRIGGIGGIGRIVRDLQGLAEWLMVRIPNLLYPISVIWVIVTEIQFNNTEIITVG